MNRLPNGIVGTNLGGPSHMSLLETVNIACPYCGEPNELVIDTSVPQQEYVEDCGVCCQPILLQIMVGEGTDISVEARRENE